MVKLAGLGKVLSQPTTSAMAKPAIAYVIIYSARQNKVICDKSETKGFILYYL